MFARIIHKEPSATYILGFCGGNPEQKAIDRLKETAALKPNQTLANYSFVKSKRIILGLVSIKTITVTADVIEFK